MAKVIDVAAGVLIRQQAAGEPEILLAQRPSGKHMAGYWEFPGGKFEANESAEQALARELEEEIGVCIAASEPLIQLVHHYPERSVRLHVRTVREWTGELQSLDQQALRWVPQSQLSDWQLLPADGPIVRAIQLPSHYAISADATDWNLAKLEAQLAYWEQQQVKLLQWRQSGFAEVVSPSAQDIDYAERVVAWARKLGITVLLNCAATPEGQRSWASQLGFDGIHLKSSYLNSRSWATDLERLAAGRKSENWGYLAASCHSVDELRAAEQLGCDFAVFGPVKPTASHPDAPTLGWQAFAQAVRLAGLPVYALGGCELADIPYARTQEAQGIAGISTFNRP